MRYPKCPKKVHTRTAQCPFCQIFANGHGANNFWGKGVPKHPKGLLEETGTPSTLKGYPKGHYPFFQYRTSIYRCFSTAGPRTGTTPRLLLYCRSPKQIPTLYHNSKLCFSHDPLGYARSILFTSANTQLHA